MSTVRLLTGRTHQIRAQFQALGSPVFGDVDYGGEKLKVELGVGLCSRKLSFLCPQTRESFQFALDAPNFEDLLL